MCLGSKSVRLHASVANFIKARRNRWESYRANHFKQSSYHTAWA
jgi:hypothetical protein